MGKQRKGSWFAGFTLPLDGGVPPTLVEPNLPSLFLPTGFCEPMDLGCHWRLSGREELPGGRQLYFSQAHVDGRWDARVPGYVLSPNPQPGASSAPPWRGLRGCFGFLPFVTVHLLLLCTSLRSISSLFVSWPSPPPLPPLLPLPSPPPLGTWPASFHCFPHTLSVPLSCFLLC